MRVHAQDPQVHGQHVAVMIAIVLFSGGDVDRLRADPQKRRYMRRLLFRKKQAHFRLHSLRLAAGQHVHHEDGVRVRLEHPGDVLAAHVRLFPRRPAEPLTRRVSQVAGQVFVRKAGLGFFLVQAARRRGRIDTDAGVMQDPGVVHAKLKGAHIAPPFDRDRCHKVTEHVRASGGQRVGFGHGHDQVGLAQLPPFRKLRRRRQVGRIAFGCALLHPLRQHRNLPVAEPALTGEAPIARFGQPGRHEAVLGDAHDLRCALAYILVGEQAKGPRFSRAMAASAVLEDKRRNVFRERERVGRVWRGGL